MQTVSALESLIKILQLTLTAPFAIHRDFELGPDDTHLSPQILTPRLYLTPPLRLGLLPQAMDDENMADVCQ